MNDDTTVHCLCLFTPVCPVMDTTWTQDIPLEIERPPGTPRIAHQHETKAREREGGGRSREEELDC